MSEAILFNWVFGAQILLLSLYFPLRVLRHAASIYENYPPETYPKLYPRSMGGYKRMGQIFKSLCVMALVLGGVMLYASINELVSLKALTLLATAYFLFQAAPFVYLEMGMFKEWKLMRESQNGRRRKAELAPRRFMDFLPKGMLVIWAVCNVGFFVFMFYIKQFNYPWFGGYANIAAMTFMNLFFAFILGWNIYGQKKNPHQDFNDRRKQIRGVAMVLIFINVAAEIFVAISVSLSALDMRSYQIVVLTLYHIAIGMMGFRSYLCGPENYDVYRDDNNGLATARA